MHGMYHVPKHGVHEVYANRACVRVCVRACVRTHARMNACEKVTVGKTTLSAAVAEAKLFDAVTSRSLNALTKALTVRNVHISMTNLGSLACVPHRRPEVWRRRVE